MAPLNTLLTALATLTILSPVRAEPALNPRDHGSGFWSAVYCILSDVSCTDEKKRAVSSSKIGEAVYSCRSNAFLHSDCAIPLICTDYIGQQIPKPNCGVTGIAGYNATGYPTCIPPPQWNASFDNAACTEPKLQTWAELFPLHELIAQQFGENMINGTEEAYPI